MQSNYKPIGDYIQLVDERNKELKVTRLLGLSISKEFIRSVANTVGTDMRNYKIIRKNQFACSTMQVRRDRKMPVALLTDFDEAIISQAYPIFEIRDETQLLPEYLMMWFSREEFDRQAEFLAVGGVRGTLEWEDFLAMELPIPSIEKQQEIVKEYHTITKRIQLNEQLNQKLEETAQALYKHWFVDFEFPNENGEPYKSSAGVMVYNIESDKEIPEDWKLKKLESLIDYKKGNAFKSDDYIEYGNPVVRVSDLTHNSIDFNECLFVNDSIVSLNTDYLIVADDIIITSVGSWPQNPLSVVGKVVKAPRVNILPLLNQNMVRIRAIDKKLQLLLYTILSRKDFSEYVISGAQGSANQASVTLKHLFAYNICLPNDKNSREISQKINKLYSLSGLIENESFLLKKIKELLLSKMATVGSELV